jgi:transposase
VDTTENLITRGRRRRRHHSVFFKAEAVSACQQPGVSIAAVALERGLNANLLRRWVQEAERSDAPIAIRPASPSAMPAEADGFIRRALSRIDSPWGSAHDAEINARFSERLKLQMTRAGKKIGHRRS